MSEISSTEGAITESSAERRISGALRGIRYGSVEVVIHDSRIVQVERREKIRFDSSGDIQNRQIRYLPANWRDKLTNFSKDALLTTMERIVLPTLDSGSPAISNMQPLIEPDSGDWLRKIKTAASGNWFHRILVTLTGAGGGALGFVTLPVELPVTTGLFLRSIMDVASREGADLNDPATMLQCMNVFALGGDSERDDQANEGYYAVRLALAKSVAEALDYLAANQGVKRAAQVMAAPQVVQMIVKVAARYGITLGEKVTAQAIPVVGGATGALINYFFMDYFQSVAWAHFYILRLEKQYGEAEVRLQYNRFGEACAR